MVASSVVSTILILNYHHRNADTHEMADWVMQKKNKKKFKKKPFLQRVHNCLIFHFPRCASYFYIGYPAYYVCQDQIV